MNNVNIRPTKNRILAKQIVEKTEPKPTGIITSLSDLQEEKLTNRLDIIRVGKEVEEVKEGDVVIFDNRGTRVMHDGETYIFLEEKNVYGIVE